MALVEVRFFSEALGMSRTMNVILPQQQNGVGQDGAKDSGGDIPVLYLLHGGSDNHTTWQRNTSIERYALSRGLAVVMPAADNSCYTDMKHGYDYFKFFGEELPQIIREFFPNITQKREKTFVAGQSMGGYGSLKLGTLYPERFSKVGFLSSMIATERLFSKADFSSFGENIFGSQEEASGSINDSYFIMDRLIAEGKQMPEYYCICGTEDFLYQDNVDFYNHYKDKINLKYHEEPGEHEWGFWDRNIQIILDWMVQ